MTENESFTFHVDGTPVTQGSMIATGRGRGVRHTNHAALTAWRTRIAIAAVNAVRAAGVKTPIDQPVTVEAVFHLDRPKRPRFNIPATKPDLDKLQRAVGDALCPKNKAMRVLAEDSRIIEWRSVKRYTNPLSRMPGVTVTITITKEQ
jgi:crossover junction endodeoxyribonuclease RusA